MQKKEKEGSKGLFLRLAAAYSRQTVGAYLLIDSWKGTATLALAWPAIPMGHDYQTHGKFTEALQSNARCIMQQ